MKTKSLFALVFLFFFVACQKEVNIVPDDQQAKIEFPDRPVQEVDVNYPLLRLKGGGGNFDTQDLAILTPADLVAALIGSGSDAPLVSNITYTGAPVAAGVFVDNTATPVFGFAEGIVLSTGNISNLSGPNESSGSGQSNNQAGDSDLDALIPGYSTNDAAILEFDFECEYLQEISFQFVFASEEYNEYVGSDFNDVFGFFVNGVNIALIPETTIPISVNNLNCGNPYGSADNHCALFINNETDAHNTEMDGFTVVLNAYAKVNPGTNTIKLAIADAGDYILDSKVLIKGESFICAPPQPEYLDVDIEIKTDDETDTYPNAINCTKGSQLIQVSVKTTETFDALTIDHETVTFEGAFEFHKDKKTGMLERHEEDVDGDGDMDLVFHFLLSETDLDCESTEAILMGETIDGKKIKGSDSVWMIIVPKKGNK